MSKYLYKAKDRQARTVKGEVEAKNRKQAALLVKERDLIVFSLSETRESPLKNTLIRLFQRVGLGDITTFTRQLSTMITAGLTLPEALDLLKGQTKPALSLIIEDILNAIEAGASFAEALKKHEQVFGKVYIALVTAGEAAGVLDEVLARLADNLEKQKEFRGKIKGAMVYPIIIILGMVGVAGLMMVLVIPKLLTMYTEFGAELPLPTKVLIILTGFISKFWPILIVATIGTGWLVKMFLRTRTGRKKVDRLILRIPVLGGLIKKILLVEITRTLGLLVGAGISLIEGLQLIGDGVNNLVYQEGLLGVRRKVEKGSPVGLALAEDESFPSILAQMISVGEETGKLDEILIKVSHYFGQESEEAVKGLTTMIEPLIIVLLGIGVGFLIIAVIMPMYQLTTQF